MTLLTKKNWGIAVEDFIHTIKNPDYPRVVTVNETPLYNFVMSKITKNPFIDRIEQGVIDTFETQHYNIIWLIKCYEKITPLLRHAIASTVLLCIRKMFDSLQFIYIKWITTNECNEYDYKVLLALKDSTITVYTSKLLNIHNRYDTDSLYAISRPIAL